MDKIETVNLLKTAIIVGEDDANFVAETISFVESTQDFWSARSISGHLTASAWVVTENGSDTLLLHNVKFDLWLPPGGHGEDIDQTIEGTSRREGGEEAGLTNLKLVSSRVFDVDVHPIPEKKGISAHKHHDVRFIYSVDAVTASKVVLDGESKGYQWVKTLDLVKPGQSRSIQRMAQKTIELFGLTLPPPAVSM